MGHQYARGGSGYVGLYTFSWPNGDGSPFREIIGTRLTSPLEAGKKYFVSFWVSPGFGSYQKIKAFTDKIGVRFSMQPYSWDSQNPIPAAPIDNFAHLYTDSIFTDTNRWHLVSGSFIADKPYPYLMVGNFFNDEHTDTIEAGFAKAHQAYYYIDDMCLSSAHDYCYKTDSLVDADSCSKPFTVYPNPASSKLTITLPCSDYSQLIIYDAIGRAVLRNDLGDEHGNILEITLDSWAAGTYFIHLNTSTQRYMHKLIIVH